MEVSPGEVTLLLQQVRNGGSDAEDRLIALVYSELRRLAASYLRREAPDHTLQPTALVHEAYLRLTHIEQIDWQNRSHFFAVSAKIMRRILVDHARAQKAEKRGDGYQIIGLDEAFVSSAQKAPHILALDEALDRLSKLDERQCRIVELRFFSGMSEEEIAEVLGLSSRTVKRDWRAARAWLYRELSHDQANQPGSRTTSALSS